MKILTTSEFEQWIQSQPQKTKAIVKNRIDFIAIGYLGDHKKFDGLIELRWKNGRRIYAFKWNNMLFVVLYGGNKNGQSKDIKKAKSIRQELIDGIRTVHK